MRAAALLLLMLAGCGDDAAAPAPVPAAAPGGTVSGAAPRPADAGGTASVNARTVPPGLRECEQCHPRIVRSYLGHSMSDSLGPLRDPPAGTLVNEATGSRYTFSTSPASAAAGPAGTGPAGGDASAGTVTTLTGTTGDGGTRAQRIVGRIGAGRIDESFVGAEIDAVGRTGGRLFFTPVERITGHGLAPAPFERDTHPAGLDQPVTADCLQCHTTTDPARLPGAAAVRGAPAAGGGPRVYPAHHLGADAFERLQPLACDACHGDTARHADLMLGRLPDAGDDIGLARLADLPAGTQRDVCSRCHLEGDARLALQPLHGYGPRDEPLGAVQPVLVPGAPDDDFRLVSQVERLALSACQRGSPAMTCSSCHDPHVAVAAQGTASFDRACMQCHAGGRADCARDDDLAVRDVTGADARTADGCVDCHVRRSQPFDLPLVTTADHWVRRHIPPPAAVPMRHYADPDGPIAVFDDGRLQPALATAGGAAWRDGVRAAGLFRLGRTAEAAALLDAADVAAAAGPPPPPLVPLAQSATFQHVRGLILETAGRQDEALAAYGAALALDPQLPESRVNRASLLLGAGQFQAALDDAALLLALHPESEKGWNLRALAAARTGNLPAAAEALAASTERWGSDPATWHELGRLLARLGRIDQARAALQLAARLQPSRPGLQADLAALPPG